MRFAQLSDVSKLNYSAFANGIWIHHYKNWTKKILRMLIYGGEQSQSKRKGLINFISDVPTTLKKLQNKVTNSHIEFDAEDICTDILYWSCFVL